MLIYDYNFKDDFSRLKEEEIVLNPLVVNELGYDVVSLNKSNTYDQRVKSQLEKMKIRTPGLSLILEFGERVLTKYRFTNNKIPSLNDFTLKQSNGNSVVCKDLTPVIFNQAPFGPFTNVQVYNQLVTLSKRVIRSHEIWRRLRQTSELSNLTTEMIQNFIGNFYLNTSADINWTLSMSKLLFPAENEFKKMIELFDRYLCGSNLITYLKLTDEDEVNLKNLEYPKDEYYSTRGNLQKIKDLIKMHYPDYYNKERH